VTNSIPEACPEFDSEAEELIKSVDEVAYRDLSYQRSGMLNPLLSSLYYLPCLLANRMKMDSVCDSYRKEAQYAELSSSWGNTTVSRPFRAPVFYLPDPTGPVEVVRNEFKTPPPRKLRSRRQLLNDDVAGQISSPVLSSISGNASKIKNEGDSDPFFNDGDEPAFLPDNVEPKEYLTQFGYTPPPLFTLNKDQLPPRSPSPSDYGDSLY